MSFLEHGECIFFFFLNKKMKWSPHSNLNSIQVNFHGTLNGKAMFWILAKNDCKIANLNLSLENERQKEKKMPFKTTNFYQIGNSRCLVVLVVNFYREKWILYKKKSAQKWHTLQVVECYTPDSQLIWLRHSIKVTYTSAIFWDCLSY